MKGRTVFVTGSSGFIGQSVVRHLLNEGYSVHTLIRESSSWPFPEHPNLTTHIGDMRDCSSLEHGLTNSDSIVHLAAAKSDEKDSEATNVGGAKNLLRAAKYCVD